MADPLVARRGPGRPRLPADAPPRPKPRHVRFDVEADDAICRLSLHTGLSINALVRLAVRRFMVDARGGTLVLGTERTSTR